MSIEKEKFIKLDEDEMVIKKADYARAEECKAYIEYMSRPTFSESLTKYVAWALGSTLFDKLFFDPEFKKHWHAMRERLIILESAEAKGDDSN